MSHTFKQKGRAFYTGRQRPHMENNIQMEHNVHMETNIQGQRRVGQQRTSEHRSVRKVATAVHECRSYLVRTSSYRK